MLFFKYLRAKGIYMNENDIGTLVVNTAIALHKQLGPGLLETVYESVLTQELSGMKVGYLLNFGEELMKTGITRTVNGFNK